MSERIESLFAAVHGSAPGTDGRIFVATTTSVVGPSRRLVRRSDMSGVEVKADSKSMASFGRFRGRSGHCADIVKVSLMT